MTQHVTPPIDYRQLYHLRAKMARLRIQSAAIEREQQRRNVVNAIRTVVKHAPVIVPVKAKPTLRYMLPIGPTQETGKPIDVPKSIAQIQREVCDQFGISLVDLLSQRRQAEIVLPRHFAMWRCKKETPRSLPEIGRRFGGRDHTTILSAVRRIDRMISEGKITEQGKVLIVKGKQRQRETAVRKMDLLLASGELARRGLVP